MQFICHIHMAPYTWCKKLNIGGSCMKCLLDIRGTVVQSPKCTNAPCKHHTHLHKNYIIITHKLYKIDMNYVILNRPEMLNSSKVNSLAHQQMTNAWNTYDWRKSHMDHERTKFHTWKIRKMYIGAVWHDLKPGLISHQPLVFTLPR